MDDIVLHHNAPKALMELIKLRGGVPAGFDLDMVPGVIMDKKVHERMHGAQGLNTLLKSLKSQTNLESPQLAEQVFDFYRLNGQSDQAVLFKAFMMRIGIVF